VRGGGDRRGRSRRRPDAAQELAGLAAEEEVPYLRAPAGRAVWAVRLAEVDARGTLVELRAAEAVWQELEAPYEAARTRLLVGRACGELGDGSEAELSIAAATAVFEQLGAGPELGQIKPAEAAPRDSA
jgi:hypothetical protein